MTLSGARRRRLQPTPPTASAAAVGTTRAAPVPLGEPATAAGARLRVLEVLTGPEATDAVLAADPSNGPPLDGVGYVLVRLAIENAGDRPLLLSNDDFALVGASGLVRRFLWLTPPNPPLPAEVSPGEAGEGWVVLSAPVGETGLVLLYDNLFVPGDWATCYLALEPTEPTAAAVPVPPNRTGTDPAAPAGVGEPVVTAEWRLELLEAVRGAAVFDLVDYRTGALGIDDAAGASDGSIWLALRFRIANNAAADRPATLPANAFVLTDPAGNPLLDLLTLTPPYPDAAGASFPGAEQDGWVAFDLPLDAGPTLVRFLPYAGTTDAPDPRWFASG